MKFNLETIAEGIKVTGIACVKKETIKSMLSQYIENEDILREILNRMKSLNGETVYLDLDLTLKIGSE